MRKVKLYGKLGETFGREFDLNVNSIGEAVRALKVNLKGFAQYLVDSSKYGIKYRVIIGGEDHTCDEDLIIKHGKDKDFCIVPVPESQKATVRAIVGVVLIIIGAITYEYGGAYLVNIGLALLIGGIAEIILGKQQGPLGKIEDEEQSAGFTFNSQSNSVKQGGPVPICYGETIIGSQLVNFYQLSSDYGESPTLALSVFKSENDTDAVTDTDERFLGINIGSTAPIQYQPSNPYVPVVTQVNVNDFGDFFDDIDIDFGVSL